MQKKYNMNQKIKNELFTLLILFLIMILVGKIIFYQEKIFTIIRISASIFYLVIFPGYFLTVYYIERFDFIARAIFGSITAAACYSVVAYNIGLLGFGIKLFAYLAPILTILIFTYLNRKKIIESS